ncbi:MAG: hypothetical protein ABI824_06660 [Acidobacteriota bacterium]
MTKDRADLEKAQRNFVQTRDSQLRFPQNSLQCSESIWKEALHGILERSDVVVMDLSGLTEKNRGSAYEIGKLVNEVPLDRFLLLIDDETDLVYLRGLLADVAGGHPSGGKLRLFNMGVQPKRKENETIYDWQHRTPTPIDTDRLIGLLYEAACGNRPPHPPTVVAWTHPAFIPAPKL